MKQNGMRRGAIGDSSVKKEGAPKMKMPTFMRVAKILKRSDQFGRQGQIAVGFIVLMALLVVLTSFTMNLGEVARIKTATSNSADSGALAGASWVASGENEAAKIAEAMWINVLIAQAIFLIPFCLNVCWAIVVIFAVLVLINYVYLRTVANMVLQGAWDNAHIVALFTAIRNAWIDDTRGDRKSVV